MRTPLLLSPALLLASCTGIPQGWQEAKRTPPGHAVSGAWVGTWRSDTNGHSGGLRAVATRQNDGLWHFRYQASWAKIFSAGFDMQATVKSAGRGAWTVSGGKDLGRLYGGTFTCNGTVRDGQFNARYESRIDHGVMEMRRLTEAGAPQNASSGTKTR